MFWIVFWGSVVLLTVMGLWLGLRSRRPALRRLGFGAVALIGAVIAWGAMPFAVGTPLWSLEGAWLWPLAVVSVAVAIAAGRAALRADER